jgi:serine/threonine protein kinase
MKELELSRSGMDGTYGTTIVSGVAGSERDVVVTIVPITFFRWRKPAKIAACLKEFMSMVHPCLVSVIGFVMPELALPNSFGIISPFMSHGSVQDYLNNRDLHEQKWSHVNPSLSIYLIAVGMKYLSEKGRVHGFLKPSNVLFGDDFYPKISGYWMSTVIPSDFAVHVQGANAKYAAPELFEADISESSDVFSWALITSEMLLGEIPRTVKEWERMESGPMLLPSKMPTSFTELLWKCLDRNPEKRPDFKFIVDRMRGNREFCLTGTDVDKYIEVSNSIY